MCNSSQYGGGGTALLQCRVKVRFREQVKFVHLALLGNSIAIKGFCKKMQVPNLRVSG